VDPRCSQDTLIGTPPEDWNALLGTLTRWHSPDPLRAYSVMVSSVYPYTALLHGFELANVSNHGITPKYYLLIRCSPGNLEEIRRVYTMLRILNVRYVVISGGHDCWDHTQSRPVLQRPDATLYELTQPLPRVWAPQAAALLIGEDDDGDFNSMEANLIVYHPAFDPARWAVFSAPTHTLDDLPLETLRLFQAVILTRPRIRDPQLANAMLDAYQQAGGVVLHLSYAEYRYGDPTYSMISNQSPAKQLSSDAQTLLAKVLTDDALRTRPTTVITREDHAPFTHRLRVETSQEITPLVISETYYPGWRATIDGRATPLYMADGIVRGVIVRGRGTHVIAVSYQPRSLLLGGFITVTSAVAVWCLWVLRTRRRKIGGIRAGGHCVEKSP